MCIHTEKEKANAMGYKDSSCCFAAPYLYYRRKETSLFGQCARLNNSPAFLQLSGISSTLPTTESEPLALEAMENVKAIHR